MKTEQIEDIILTRGGQWEFDEHVSMVFDSHVRKSIPCYDVIQRLIAQISRKILPDNALVYDLGTATGEVIYNLHKANTDKHIRFIGIDRSLPMIQKARLKCNSIRTVEFYNERIESFNYEPSDLMVAAFTFQFIPKKDRKPTLIKIKDALKPGGVFIFCEKINYMDQNMNTFYTRVYEDWKLNHFTKNEITAKRESLKHVMLPLTLEENINLLKTAGFEDITVFFSWCNFICLLVKRLSL